MSRIFNFSAGPATLPQPVLEAVAAEMLENSGLNFAVGIGLKDAAEKVVAAIR